MEIDTALAAEKLLRRNHIDPNMYSVGPPKSTECMVIENIDGVWCTYFWERGQKGNIRKHNTEREAVVFFLEKVVRIASLSEKREVVLS